MTNQQNLDVLYVSDKLVIARLPCTMWPIFSSFLKFCCYYTRLKSGEISETQRKTSQIAFGTVR